MLTLTITLEGSDHQIMLAFDSMESRNAAGRLINSMSDDKCEFTQVTDDYGQMVTWKTVSLVHTVMTDPEKHWRFKNAMSIIKLRAEHDFNNRLQQEPDLKFLVGGARPSFGKQ